MSDTQRAMREFRFLEEKRKVGGLSPAEEQRWIELRHVLGAYELPVPHVAPTGYAEPAGYYGADGNWYPYPEPDPAAGNAYAEGYVHEGAAAAVQYPVTPDGYPVAGYDPNVPIDPAAGYADPWGAAAVADGGGYGAQQPIWDPAQQAYVDPYGTPYPPQQDWAAGQESYPAALAPQPEGTWDSPQPHPGAQGWMPADPAAAQWQGAPETQAFPSYPAAPGVDALAYGPGSDPGAPECVDDYAEPVSTAEYLAESFHARGSLTGTTPGDATPDGPVELDASEVMEVDGDAVALVSETPGEHAEQPLTTLSEVPLGELDDGAGAPTTPRWPEVGQGNWGAPESDAEQRTQEVEPDPAAQALPASTGQWNADAGDLTQEVPTTEAPGSEMTAGDNAAWAAAPTQGWSEPAAAYLPGGDGGAELASSSEPWTQRSAAEALSSPSTNPIPEDAGAEPSAWTPAEPEQTSPPAGLSAAAEPEAPRADHPEEPAGAEAAAPWDERHTLPDTEARPALGETLGRQTAEAEATLLVPSVNVPSAGSSSDAWLQEGSSPAAVDLPEAAPEDVGMWTTTSASALSGETGRSPMDAGTDAIRAQPALAAPPPRESLGPLEAAAGAEPAAASELSEGEPQELPSIDLSAEDIASVEEIAPAAPGAAVSGAEPIEPSAAEEPTRIVDMARADAAVRPPISEERTVIAPVPGPPVPTGGEPARSRDVTQPHIAVPELIAARPPSPEDLPTREYPASFFDAPPPPPEPISAEEPLPSEPLPSEPLPAAEVNLEPSTPPLLPVVASPVELPLEAVDVNLEPSSPPLRPVLEDASAQPVEELSGLHAVVVSDNTSISQPLDIVVDEPGQADEAVPLATNAELVQYQRDDRQHPVLELVSADVEPRLDVAEHSGAMEVESGPMAMLANPDQPREAVGGWEDAPVPLASNADFLDTAELRGTGEPWSPAAATPPADDAAHPAMTAVDLSVDAWAEPPAGSQEMTAVDLRVDTWAAEPAPSPPPADSPHPSLTAVDVDVDSWGAAQKPAFPPSVTTWPASPAPAAEDDWSDPLAISPARPPALRLTRPAAGIATAVHPPPPVPAPLAVELPLETVSAEWSSDAADAETADAEEISLVEELPAPPVPAATSAAHSGALPAPGRTPFARIALAKAPAPAAGPSVPPREELFGKTGLNFDALPSPSPVPASAPTTAAPASAPEPTFIEGEHRVIVHTVEGQVKRGVVRDIDLGDDVLALQNTGSPAENIPTQRVKAVFFMLPAGGHPPAITGEKIRVVFTDGRQVAGFSTDHTSAGTGFFLIPADNRTNTARIYIYRSSVQTLSVG